MSAIHEPSKMALRFSSSQDSSMTRRVLCFSFFRSCVVARKKVVFVFLLTKKMTRKAKRKKRKKKVEKSERETSRFLFSPPPPRALSLVRSSLAALASFFVLSLSLSRARDSRRFFSLSLSLSFACVSPHACFACVFLKKEKISIF